MTLINPIFSERKSVGLELTIQMMYEYKSPIKRCWWCGVAWKVIIVSALSLHLRDKDRFRDREIERA